MPRSDLAALAATLGLAGAATAAELTIATWGGAYEAAQRAALFEPFAAETGNEVVIVEYGGAAAALRDRAPEEGWDVIDMTEDQALIACEAGELLPIDHAALVGDDGVSDFEVAQLLPCAAPQNVYASVIAYDDAAFPGVKPTRLEDFFDLEQFPGRRALPRSPDVILEWAMMAEGAPPEQVYDLLSTDRGLRLVFRRLETIRDAIVWYDGPDAAARMLRDGEATMAGGYNGRFFAAAAEGAPLTIIWDGRVIGHEVWAIPLTADQPEAALEFLAFASDPASMARLAERIPYGPARRSAFERIGLNPDTGAPMRPHLPNAPHSDARTLLRDSVWYARTADLRARRFAEWLGEDASGE